MPEPEKKKELTPEQRLNAWVQLISIVAFGIVILFIAGKFIYINFIR